MQPKERVTFLKLLCVDFVTNRVTSPGVHQAANLFASFVCSKIHSSAGQRLLQSID
jgi:hypothetical protein